MSKRKLIKETVKKHIPQRHLSSVRIMYRICMETIYGIKRTGLINIAIVAAMAAILTIFGALFRTSYSLSSYVKKVTIVTKEQAWEEMNKDIDVSGMENPLPDTLHVTVDDPSNIVAVCDSMKNLSDIESMSYAQEIAKKLQTITNVFNTVTVLVLIGVAMLTIIIINCTIQLVIQSRKEEIEIMRLMGVSNWYIKIPLILQGAIYGFIGAIISLIPLNTVQNALSKLHEFLNVAPSPMAMNIVVLCLFVMAIFFSASGSMLSIKKHLQV